MADWNWFFSAAAQSAAAIVGIFAAFIITKIINNQTEFARKNSRIDELLVKSSSIRDQISSRYIKWFTEHKMKSAMEDLEAKMILDIPRRSPEEYFNKIAFPSFIEKSFVLSQIENAIAELESTQARSASPDNANVQFPNANITRIYQDQAIERAAESHLYNEIQVEGEAITQLVNETRKHAHDILKLHDDVRQNRESSSLVAFSIVMIAAMFFAGVVYPLSFLPLAQHWGIDFSLNSFLTILFSIKGFWLTLMSVLFLVILVTFLVINSRLKYNSGQLECLKRDSDVSNYSEYFRIMEENRK